MNKEIQDILLDYDFEPESDIVQKELYEAIVKGGKEDKMTNDELKKKLSDIIQKAGNDYGKFFRQELEEAFHKGKKHFGNRDCSMTFYDYIADALIAAGIGDVKEAEAEANRYEMLYKLQNRDMALAERRAHDAEHRAEVAERALKRFAENISCEDCPFFSDCSSLEKMKDSVHSNYCFAEYLRQAEKELAEERKDD